MSYIERSKDDFTEILSTLLNVHPLPDEKIYYFGTRVFSIRQLVDLFVIDDPLADKIVEVYNLMGNFCNTDPLVLLKTITDALRHNKDALVKMHRREP